MMSMDEEAVSFLRSAVARSLNEASPFEPAIFHFPLSEGGYTIIALDSQKPWERVSNYARRVLALLRMKNLTKIKDPVFTCRVFLGGLRPGLMYEIFKLKIDAYKLEFQQAYLHVWNIEKRSVDKATKVADLKGIPPPKWRDNIDVNRVPVKQDGLEFFGEPNIFIDAYYYRTEEKKLKILYRAYE